MHEYNLLGHQSKLTRDVTSRIKDKEINRTLALQFGEHYFDGSRAQGYGGYRYDGRWVAVAKRLISKFQLDESSKFLDVGCAKGFLMQDLKDNCPGITVQGLDVSNYARLCARDDVMSDIDIGNCENLPYPDNSFDVCVAINTIHNLDYEGCSNAIRELMRVVKDQKNIFIQVDAYSSESERDMFEAWMLTAKTYLRPDDWLDMFRTLGYQGSYFWTVIGFSK